MNLSGLEAQLQLIALSTSWKLIYCLKCTFNQCKGLLLSWFILMYFIAKIGWFDILKVFVVYMLSFLVVKILFKNSTAYLTN